MPRPANRRTPHHHDAAGLVRAYAKGQLDPRDVMAACWHQIDTLNPVFNAFCYLDRQASTRAAAASARRWTKGQPLGPLDGVPVTVKDWYDVKGWPTRQGSLTTSDAPREADSFAVSVLKKAGAIIIGKTTLPEFGHKGVTHSPLSGITRNPWDPDKTPGGSSGGAAVAAACGMGWLHLGSDAGGSLRIPASFSGVVGFKPSPGIMPGWPPSLFSSLSSMGPLTRSVADAVLMVRVLAAAAQNNPRDAHRVGVTAAEKALSEPRITAASLRIAVADSINGVVLSPEAQKLWRKQKKYFSTLGRVTDISLRIDRVTETFAAHWTAVAGLMARDMNAATRRKLDPRFRHWVTRGEKQHLHDYMQAEYNRMLIAGYFSELFSRFDVLITPATPFTAFDVGLDMPKDARGRPHEDWNIFSAFANLARLPALSLPLGVAQNGLPLGVQITAPFLHDGLVLACGRRLEKALGFDSWLER